jgi:hypothetical protein
MKSSGSGRVMLAGLGAAAAMLVGAAPAAHADDLTDIVKVVDADYAAGQTAFTVAFTDFGNADIPHGLAQFINGVDDDFIGAPDNFFIGSVDALTNEPVYPDPLNFGIAAPPADLAAAWTEAQSDYNIGQSWLSDAATAFSAGEYATSAFDSTVGSIYSFDVPPEFLFMGAIDQLLGA